MTPPEEPPWELRLFTYSYSKCFFPHQHGNRVGGVFKSFYKCFARDKPERGWHLVLWCNIVNDKRTRNTDLHPWLCDGWTWAPHAVGQQLNQDTTSSTEREASFCLGQCRILDSSNTLYKYISSRKLAPIQLFSFQVPIFPCLLGEKLDIHSLVFLMHSANQ